MFFSCKLTYKNYYTKWNFVLDKILSTVIFSPQVYFFKKKAGKIPSFATILIPAGFEPATVRLEGECSIQLSYET